MLANYPSLVNVELVEIELVEIASVSVTEEETLLVNLLTHAYMLKSQNRHRKEGSHSLAEGMKKSERDT